MIEILVYLQHKFSFFPILRIDFETIFLVVFYRNIGSWTKSIWTSTSTSNIKTSIFNDKVALTWNFFIKTAHKVTPTKQNIWNIVLNIKKIIQKLCTILFSIHLIWCFNCFCVSLRKRKEFRFFHKKNAFIQINYYFHTNIKKTSLKEENIFLNEN